MTKQNSKIVNISYLLLVMLLAAGLSRAEEVNLPDYRPLLQVGQTWLVEVETKSEPPSLPREMLKGWKSTLVKTYYQFVVENRQETDNEPCFIIKIEVVSASGEDMPRTREWIWSYRIFIREKDYTLKKVQRLSKDGSKDGPATVEVSWNFSTGPIDATDLVGVLPMDFPYFDANAVKYEPEEKVSSDGKMKKRPMNILSQEVNESEIIIDKEKRGAVKIILKDKRANEVKHETTQIWVKGMPWWIEAVHKQNGKEWCTARLIKVDKKEIVSQRLE
jgi:hypothetical protein